MQKKEKMKEIQFKTICNRKFEIGNSLSLNPCQSVQIRGSKMHAAWSSLRASGSKMCAVVRRWHKNARPCASWCAKITPKPDFLFNNKENRKIRRLITNDYPLTTVLLNEPNRLCRPGQSLPRTPIRRSGIQNKTASRLSGFHNFNIYFLIFDIELIKRSQLRTTSRYCG
jgi:hypothetical protein